MINDDVYRRLAIETDAWCDQNIGVDVDLRYNVIWEKKYAELIIKECIGLILPNADHRRDASWGYLGGTEGVELLDANVDSIKEYFGVEE